MSAGVRADPEGSGSRAGVHVVSRVSGTWGNVGTVTPWPLAADGRPYIREPRGYSSP